MQKMQKMPKIRSTTLYCKNAVDVRWRLEYSNKPAKFGMWNNPGVDTYSYASFQDRDGLVYACIEVKDIVTRQLKVLARCSAADYEQHRWIAAAPMPLKSSGLKVEGGVQGMTLVTRDQKLHVYKDGLVKIEKMEERNIQL